MDHDELFATLIDVIGHDADPDAQLLDTLIQDARSRARMLAEPTLPPRLARLAQARSGVDCATVLDDLAALIDAELAGEDTAALYGAVKVHLRHCVDCYEQYALAQRMIDLQRKGSVPGWPIDVSAPPLRFQPALLIVPRQEVQRAVTMHARQSVMRGTREHQYIVYDGDMPGQGGMFVEVTLVRPPARPDSWNIVVQLQGSDKGTNRDVWLQCGQEVRVTTLNDQSEARFEDVPDTWFHDENPNDLEVSIIQLRSS